MTGEAEGLKNYRRATVLLNHVHLAAVFVRVERSARLVAHKSAGHKVFSDCASQFQRPGSCGVINEVAESRVHVHRGSKAGGHGALHVRAEGGPVRVAVFLKGKQDGGDAADAAPRADQ